MPNVEAPSCMSLFVEVRCNGKAFSSGSGIIGCSPAGRPALLTNWHVVTGRRPDSGALLDSQARVPDEVAIVFLAQTPDESLVWTVKVEKLFDDTGKQRWVEHPIHGQKVDAVALPLSDVTGLRLMPYVGPGVTHQPIMCRPADVVSVIGFPFGLTGGGALALWATGFVASEPAVDRDNLPLFLIDCRARSGQSGSAVIAFRGGGAVHREDGGTAFFDGPIWRFLGLYSGRINSESDLGLVWKRAALEEILATVP